MTEYPHEIHTRMRRISVAMLSALYLAGVAYALYYVSSVSVRPSPDRPVEIVRQSGLRMQSEPSGAEVLINGSVIGTTPLSNPELTPGPHQLELRLDGYQSWRGLIDLPVDEFVEVDAVRLIPSRPDTTTVTVPADQTHTVGNRNTALVRYSAAERRLTVLSDGQQQAMHERFALRSIICPPVATTLVAQGLADGIPCLIVVETGGLRLRVERIDRTVTSEAPPEGLIPVSLAAGGEMVWAFLPDQAVTLGGAGVERHELWHGSLAAWGAPEDDWYGIDRDGTYYRLGIAGLVERGTLATPPEGLPSSRIVWADNDSVLLRASDGQMLQWSREHPPLPLTAGSIDTLQVDGGALILTPNELLFFDASSEAVVQTDATLEAAESFRSIVGMTSSALVVLETSSRLIVVPLFALISEELELEPITLIDRLASDSVVTVDGDALVTADKNQVIWHSLSEPAGGDQ